MTVLDHVFARLVELGVDHIFGVPGDFSLAIMDRLESTSTVDWVGTSGELGAAYAADGYARNRGYGALLTAFGVGELSAATGVAGATAEDVAVLHIVVGPATRAVNARSPLHHTFHDGDFDRFRRAAANLTETNFSVGLDAPTATIDRAFVALRSTKRPVYLLLPQDVAEIAAATPAPLSLPRVAPTAIKNASDLLSRFFTEVPDAVAVLGHLIWRRECGDVGTALARRGARIAELPNALGSAPRSEPTYVGVYNGKLSSPPVRDEVEGSHGRVLIGCVLSDTTTGGLSHRFEEESTLAVGRDAIVWRDQRVDLPFESACRLLLEYWPPRNERFESAAPGPSWRAPVEGDESVISLRAVWAALLPRLSPGTRLFVDTGSSFYGLLDSRIPEGIRVESATLWAAIGWSLPAGIGSAIAARSEHVVVVIGDGAFQQVASELALVCTMGLTPVIVIIDNGGYTVERAIRGEHARYNDVPAWDYVAFSRALGLGNSAASLVHVTTPEDLERAVRTLSDDTRAHVVVVQTDPLDVGGTLAQMSTVLRAKAGLASLSGTLVSTTNA